MVLTQLSKKIKRSLFNMLMGAFRKSANLEVYTATLNVGEVVYLDNVKRTGEEDETLILIHGLGADKDTWLQLTKYLTKYLTKNYRIVIPDLPGHGESIQDFSLDYGVEAQALRLLELLKLLKIERAHFIGNSMGGAVAIRLADMQSEAVLSLILIDSFGAIKTPSYIYKLAEEIGHNPMLEISNIDDYKKMVSLAMVKPPFIPGFILDILAENMKEKVELNKKIFKDSEVDCDLSYILPKLKSPALVMWGAEDKVLHVDNAEIFYRELQNCSKVVLEKTGHVPMVEKSKVTAEHISKFINEVTYVRENNI
jgi:pimeloyl-ACP methyl ester carboxylesterase